jgi:hypothetical protein
VGTARLHRRRGYRRGSAPCDGRGGASPCPWSHVRIPYRIEDLVAPPLVEQGPGLSLRIAERTFQVIGLAAGQLVVRGPMPLPEETTLELVTSGGASARARVRACWAEGPRFGAVLAPLPVAPLALLRWRGLVPRTSGDA